MAIPVQAAFGKQESLGTGTVNVPIPASSVGDFCILLMFNDAVSASAEFLDNVTGWTFEGTGGNTDAGAHCGVYSRTIDGTEGATITVTCVTSATIDLFGYCVRYTHADNNMSVHKIQFSTEEVSTTSHAVAGVTTTDPDCRIAYGLGFDGGDGDPFSVDAAFTQTDEDEVGIGAGGLSVCFGGRDLASAGASGTATVTSTASDSSVSVQVAITPGAAGGSSPLVLYTSPGLSVTQ